MRKNFDLYKFFLKEAMGDEAPDEAPMPQQAQSPTQQKAPPQPAGDASNAFKSLQGQTITGVNYAPNGNSGGVLKIKVKSSYVPFTISWANQTVTVVDLEGNSIVLGTDS